MQHLYFHKNHTTKEQFFAAYEQLSQHQTHHILLESGRGGRYSVAGLQPDVILQSIPEGLRIQDSTGAEVIHGDPLIQLEKWMTPHRTERREDLPDFQGGVIGFLSYDYARKIEKLPSLGRDDLEIPDLYFYYLKEWAVFDHQEDCLWTMMLSEQDPESAEAKLSQWTASWENALSSKNETKKDPNDDMADVEVSMDEEEFSAAVKRIQAYISQGDVFQVNLSVRQSQQLRTEPYAVYKKLRELNPSPYMSYIHSPDFQIVSGSPELLVKKKGMEVSTRPIAGTRSRGKDADEDERLALELIHNEKERAEHVMLVDLERNDLGKVCQYGTVEVNEFMVIEKYSHVMHIVSNVRGKLDETKTGADVIRSVFPGGTITGAPKVRTMEIIEELEPVRRGIYTGSIGWIGLNGDMELNIVIRTMLVKEGIGHIQAGAGVVIDSNPAYEYKESLKKAKALWVAKAMAEGENL
ncbi:aminodeoxychorismate synthase, component I [Rossellomorea sp. DA94]|uniref:aminodeoxychorismate synthase, component I n=1 Tax=Rossellomorea sp. DA94 TaxID=3038653 RepID=UPI00244BC63B|nr:aminodeoxychorismate synthase, component I [Rossellomorea sp. DA94]WGG45764.1 aminodeoxychorismate synthase, component I [Rossellomorea sp. DA94]